MKTPSKALFISILTLSTLLALFFFLYEAPKKLENIYMTLSFVFFGVSVLFPFFFPPEFAPADGPAQH